MPERILDLFAEFRNRTNMGSWTRRDASGRQPARRSDLFWLRHHGRGREEGNAEAIGGGTWSRARHAEEILDYCETDVDALERLLPAMLPRIDLPRALLRGRYMAAAAAMEYNGVPIDVPTLELLRERWTDIQDHLIAAIDVYGVYDGRTFKADRWRKLMAKLSIPWPRLESGQLDLSDDTFRQMAKAYPVVSPLRELRSALSDLRLNDLAVGQDGRNRTILSAFPVAHRAQSAEQLEVHLRPERVAARTDQAAAGLRRRLRRLVAAGIRHRRRAVGRHRRCRRPISRAIPTWPSPSRPARSRRTPPRRHTGPSANCSSSASWPSSTAWRPKASPCASVSPVIVARDLLRAHRETYRTFWRWSDAAVDHGHATGSLHTVFGWHVHVGENSNPRSLRNFPMQANGAEMLRLAACLATERGIEVCAPVHDAFLICAPLDRLDARRRRHARRHGRGVADRARRLRARHRCVHRPVAGSVHGPARPVMWERVMRLLGRSDQRQTA